MDFFTTYIYAPFFNILIGLYWLVGRLFPTPDMGIAMIFFAVAVRLILLPIDLAGERSDEDKYEISQKIKKLKKDLSSDPIKLREEIRKVMRQSPGAIISEVVNVIIQIIIIIMLYRIFTTGLEGADLHLIYKWMPKIKEPINLMFLGKYDLSRTNSTLNIIQTIMIAINETIHLYFSPDKPTRKDFISLVIIFPIACFLVFLFLPAGKKVYIITSLLFTIVVRLVKQVLYLYYSLAKKPSVPAVNPVPASPVLPSGTNEPGTSPSSETPKSTPTP